MKNSIIGRQKEIERLDRVMNATEAQLVIVYGRRRIGKTFLINNYFENNFAFKLTGIQNAPLEVQLQNFALEFKKASEKECPQMRNWVEAFWILRDYLCSLPPSKKQVVFIDEMPWLDTPKSNFLETFEHFWNDFCITRPNLVVVVSGSATAWMSKNIGQNTGGLFNRHTAKLVLRQFSLFETELYLKSRNIYWDRYDIAQLYLVMGGVPYYLSLLDPEKMLAQNVDALFFEENSELRGEMKTLYLTLSSRCELYGQILEACAKKHYGLTRQEICKELSIQSSGVLSDALRVLVDSSFLKCYQVFASKKPLYQIADHFIDFYLKFVENKFGVDSHFWAKSVDNPSRNSWLGNSFEILVKEHSNLVKRKLGIEGVLTEESTWKYTPKEDDAYPGAQIDLLIDRRDHVISLCEIKYSLGQYVIDKEYSLKIRDKIQTFKAITKTKKSLQMVFITTEGLKTNMYSNLANAQITLDDLFLPL